MSCEVAALSLQENAYYRTWSIYFGFEAKGLMLILFSFLVKEEKIRVVPNNIFFL